MEKDIYILKRLDTGKLLINSLGLIFYTDLLKVAELQKSQLYNPDDWVIEKV